MSTTAGLRAVDNPPVFGDFDIDDDGHLVDEAPRTTFTLIARQQQGRTNHKRRYQLTAWAETDAGSLLHMLGATDQDGARQLRGIQSFMIRGLVDDDGVPLQASPRLVTDTDLEQATAAVEAANAPLLADAADGPAPIPDDTRLRALKKSALVELAEQYDLDTDGTNTDLTKRLAAERDRPEGVDETSLVTVDDGGGLVDDDARWRLVFPDGTLADDAVFASLAAANEHATQHPSSRRLFFDVTGDPAQTVRLEALTEIVEHIAGKAASRPPGRSGGSSRSRPNRGRRART